MADASPPDPVAANVAAHLPRMAGRLPYRPAIICPRGRDRYGRVVSVHCTYRQLDLASDLVAAGLAAVGIGRGVRTVLMVRPGLELFTLTFALLKAGVVPVVVDPGLGLANLSACLARAEPEAFIGVPAAQALRVLLGWARRTVRTTVTVGRRWFWGGATLDSVLAAGRRAGRAPLAPTGADDLAAIVFTSGSTGPPKGVEVRHGQLSAQVEAIRDLYGVRPGEVDLPTFPLFALFDPALGMTTVVPEMDPTRPARVDPVKIVEAVEAFGVTNMFGSPALLDTVSRYGVRHRVSLPTLERVISAGAPVPARVVERFLRLLGPGARVHTPYGATESLPVASIASDELLGEPRLATAAGRGVCVGRPVPSAEVAVIRITDEPIPTWDDGLRLADGEVGEIVVRGPMVTHAYHRAEAATAAAKMRDPRGGVRHRMGDLGYFDGQGRLWFCGRKAHRVETAAGTLYTVPCEGVFNAHPQVYRSALVGVRRPGGTEPVLCVELDREAGEVDRGRVTAELLALGAAHDHTRAIRTVLFHPSFPVDIRHNTKIRREELAGWAARRLG